jgi:hypothetical protein
MAGMRPVLVDCCFSDNMLIPFRQLDGSRFHHTAWMKYNQACLPFSMLQIQIE